MVPSDIISQMDNTNIQIQDFHSLETSWSLWIHLPNSEWDLKKCLKVYTFINVEECIAVSESLSDGIIKSCMMFIMRENIMPQWEHPRNRNGGYFSFKVLNKNVCQVWKDLTYILIGNTLSTNNDFLRDISGITISPKKNFCIIKIWMTNCEHQNPSIITEVKNLASHGCFFQPHNKNAAFKVEDEY
jgi:hypothetical protein